MGGCGGFGVVDGGFVSVGLDFSRHDPDALFVGGTAGASAVFVAGLVGYAHLTIRCLINPGLGVCYCSASLG